MRFFVSYSSVRLGHIMSSSFSNGENGSVVKVKPPRTLEAGSVVMVKTPRILEAMSVVMVKPPRILETGSVFESVRPYV